MAGKSEVLVTVTLEGIEASVKDLKNVSDEFKKTSQAGKDMVKELEASQKMMQNISDGFKKAGKAFTKYFTVPIMGGFATLGKMFSDFEYSVSKAGTLLSDSYDRELFSDQILNVSAETGVDGTQVAEGIYTALSASVPEEYVMDFSVTAHQLATAGFTEQGTAMDVLTTALNAYQMETEDATKVADILVATQDRGKTTVDALARNMGRLIPIASQNGVEFETVGASMAMLTRNGITTAEASTYLRSMFNELGRSGSRSDEVLRELSGKGFRGLMEEGKTLSDVLRMLNGYADDNNISLQDLFGNIRGGSGAMSLMIGDGKELTSLIDEMHGSGGRMNNNFEQMSDTMGYRVRVAFNEMKTAGYEIALELAPVWETVADVMGDVADKVREAVEWFKTLSEEQQVSIVKWAGFIALLGPIMLVLSGVFKALSLVAGGMKGVIWFFSKGKDGVRGFSKVMKNFKGIFKGAGLILKSVGGFLKVGLVKVGGLFLKLGGILKGLWAVAQAHPFILVATIIIAVVAAIIKNWDTVGPYFKQAWESIKQSFSEAMESLKKNWNAGLEWISEKWDAIWNGISGFFSDVWEGMKTEYSEAMTSMSNGIETAMNWISGIWNSTWGAISTFFSDIWTGMKETVSTAWDFITNVITVALLLIKNLLLFAIEVLLSPFTMIWVNFGDTLTKWWNKYMEIIETTFTAIGDYLVEAGAWVSETWNTIWTGIKNVFMEVWTSIKTFFIEIWNGIVEAVTPIIESVGTFISETWAKIKETTFRIWNGIKEFFIGIWEGIVNVFTTMLDVASEVISKVWNYIKEVTSTVWDAIVGAIKEVWNILTTFISETINALAETISEVWKGIKESASRIWNSIKTTITEVWDGLLESGSTIFNDIKDVLVETFETAKESVSETWGKIRDAIMDPITEAWEKVVEMVDNIKDALDFDWSLPDLKLPSFTKTGSFGLNPPSVPSFGLSWKATGGIATGPSVVGIGEAGDEAILPLSNKKRMKPFAHAVSSMMDKDTQQDTTTQNATSDTKRPLVLEVTMGDRVLRGVSNIISLQQDRKAKLELDFYQ